MDIMSDVIDIHIPGGRGMPPCMPRVTIPKEWCLFFESLLLFLTQRVGQVLLLNLTARMLAVKVLNKGRFSTSG